MARVQGMTPEGIRKLIAEAISFIKDLDVEDLNKLLAAFDDANGIFDVRLVEAQEEVNKAGEKAREAEASARAIIEELEKYEQAQAEEVSRILGEVAVAIDAANLASAKVPGLLARLELAERGISTANAEVEKFITKQDEFLAISQEQVTKVNDLNSGFQELNQAVDESVTKVDEANASLSLVSADLDAAKASLDAKMKQNELNISTAQAAADSNQNAISDLNEDLSGLSTKHDKLTSNFSAEVEKLEKADASLLTNMNIKVGDLNAATEAQSAAISAAKSQADKGVSDAEAASAALASYKKVNDPKVVAAQTAADQAKADATSKSAAAKQAAEEYAKEAAEAAQAQAEENAAAEALRVAQAEATAAKISAATDAQAKADEAERLAKIHADAQAKAAKEQAEATAAKDASTKADKAKTDAQAAAKVLSDKAQQAAEAAQNRADKGVTDAATALARANEANNKLPAITADVSAAAKSALEAVNALPGIRTDISTAKQRAEKGVSDAATAKSAAGAAQNRADKGVNDAAVAKQAADKVGVDLENLQIGGRNLLLASNPNSSKTSGYSWGRFNLTETLTEGEIVTFSIKGTLPEGRTSWMMFNSGGYQSVAGGGSMPPNNGGIVTWTGPWRVGSTSNNYVNVYTARNRTEHSSYPGAVHIEWIKLERGNKATDWTPAPEDFQTGIDSLINKADDLTIGLSNAATQKQYNDLNTELWGDQGSINKLQRDINANNSAFQTWQREVNGRRDIWEKASTNATEALARFAITQTQWNDVSGKATNANTKAIASHAALFEGQNKWNTVANAAIQSQATLIAKQDRWSDGVNKALAWQDQLNNSQSDINKTTKSVLANQAKWNSAQAEINNSQSVTNKAVKLVNDNQAKWNSAQAEINNSQSVTNKAVKLVNDNQKKWNTAVSQALKAHDELFVTTTKTFKAVKAVTDNQGKWNKVVSDLVTTNTAVSNANKTAIEGLARVLGITHGTSNIVPMVPGGVRTGGTNIAPIFTPMPAWMEPGGRKTVTTIPEFPSLLVAQETTTVTRRSGDYFSEVDPTIEYKYSYWVHANKKGTRFYIEIVDQDGSFALASNTPDNHSSSGTYLAGNVLAAAGWTKNTGVIKFKPGVRAARLGRIYYNHTNGVVGTQSLADIQIYPNMPSQAEVNKALSDSDKAQNLFDKNQKKWNDAASRSIATVENLWGKTAEDVGEISVLTEELGEKIKEQSDDFAKNITQLFTFIPRIAYAMDGHNVAASDTDGFVKITRTKSGSRTTRVAVEAVGRWVGTMIIEGDHGQSGGQDQTFMNQTPIRLKQAVNSATRIFYLNRNTNSDHIGAVKVTFLVDPGKVVVQYPKGTNFVPGMDKWTTLHTQALTAAESTEHNLSLSVTFSGTTYEDTYGVRIRVGSTVVAELKKSKIGPLFPGQNGTRVMSVQKAQVHIKSGTRIYLEAYSTGRDYPLRRVSKWNSQISYITSGRA